MRIEKAKIRVSDKEKKSTLPNKRVSAYTESYKGEYYNIDVEKLIPFRNQARKHFDERSLTELANTIKSHGIRQPLTVVPSTKIEGKYEIVSGERRWRAAKLIDMPKVPCIILQNDRSAYEVALIENVQRKNLHPLELMKGLQILLDKGICKNHQEIADKIGIMRTKVVEILSLKKLPYSTQSLLLEKGIKSRSALRTILKAKSEDHEKIIKELDKKAQVKIPVFSKKQKEKKTTIVSIYKESGEIVFNKADYLQLNQHQRKEIKDYLEQLVNEIQ